MTAATLFFCFFTFCEIALLIAAYFVLDGKTKPFFQVVKSLPSSEVFEDEERGIFFPKSKLLKGGKRKCIIFSILINQFLLQKMLFACETVDKKNEINLTLRKKNSLSLGEYIFGD